VITEPTPLVSGDDLQALHEAAVGMLDRRCGSARVRALIDVSETFDGSLWQEIVDLGWTGLTMPAEYGGVAAGMGAVAIVLTALGAHTAPVPFLSSAVLATTAFSSGRPPAAARWLPQLGEGQAIATVALTGLSGRIGADLDVLVRREADGYRLDGIAGFVLDGTVADVVITAARDDSTGRRCLLAVARQDGVTAEPVPCVDRTRQLTHVRFDGVHVDDAALVADRDRCEQLIDQLTDIAAFGLAADASGAADRALGLAVEYAKQRIQFGRVIGSFQAIKHKLADMFVLAEAAKAAVEGAASALDNDAVQARRRAAAAGAFVRQAASRIVGDAVQTHGGIGFTWEHDCHLLLKRAKFDEVYLTDLWTQRERLLREIEARVLET
jgi:alkylation response protein AidB-like acyl-CoA dehydrogenase